MFKQKYTILDFKREFNTDEQCLEFLFKKNCQSTNCQKCDKPFNYSKVKDRRQYQCNLCMHTIAPTSGTIMHKSPTKLSLWFFAIFLFACSKNGVSAMELQRQLGVTYKCAWRMAGQIRKLFTDDNEPLKNEVEIDETYIGGKESNKHSTKKLGNKATQGKTAVIGAVERKGNVVARVVDDTTISSVLPFVRGKIQMESTLYTDEYRSYENIKYANYSHKTVNHSAKQYVDGRVHTNTIEGFWSILKRSIDGTFHMVSPKYLQTYVNEFVWKYTKT